MKIGVFDSGLGGLSILREIRRVLPEYEYLYLGDNARAPYGARSFEVVYEYTLEAVRYLSSQGCRLIIIACNTASAKALRTIQQRDIDKDKLRVLGIIRPTVENAQGRHIGILATRGTVNSRSYVLEFEKIDKSIAISQQACEMWVPLIEYGEKDSPAADYYVDKYIRELLSQDPEIDTVLLGCTHYPLLRDKIEATLRRYAESGYTKSDSVPRVVEQGSIVAESLRDYLQRHSEIERELSRSGECRYETTESAERFGEIAEMFVGEKVVAKHVEL